MAPEQHLNENTLYRKITFLHPWKHASLLSSMRSCIYHPKLSCSESCTKLRTRSLPCSHETSGFHKTTFDVSTFTLKLRPASDCQHEHSNLTSFCWEADGGVKKIIDCRTKLTCTHVLVLFTVVKCLRENGSGFGPPSCIDHDGLCHLSHWAIHGNWARMQQRVNILSPTQLCFIIVF